MTGPPSSLRSLPPTGACRDSGRPGVPTLHLASASAGDAWSEVAARVDGWLVEVGAARRDAIVLVPFASLLPHARRAFAAREGGWMPRVETTATLAESFGPSRAPLGDAPFEHAVESALAAAAVRGAAWAGDWAARDPNGFWRAASHAARAARAIGSALASGHPADRPARIAAVRAALPPPGDPVERERLFAAVAVEWAAREALATTAAAADRLWSLEPSAWVSIEAGGADALAVELLRRAEAAGTPALRIVADPVDASRPFDDAAVSADRVRLAELDDFEDEAAAAAAQVLAHLARGERPVALVATDRELVRRVRAMLARQDLVVRDETGWKLSTTRAGARIVGLLRAVEPDARSDAVLDWAKSLDARVAADASAFEAALRANALRSAAAIDARPLEHGAARLRELWHAVRNALDGPPLRPLPAWLAQLAEALDRAGMLAPLEADEAGRQALAALRLVPALGADEARAIAADVGAVDRARFARFVDAVLEEATFLPQKPVRLVEPRAGADGSPSPASPATAVEATSSLPPVGPVRARPSKASRAAANPSAQLALVFDEPSPPVPPPPPTAAADPPTERSDHELDVIVMPLARAVLRPFAAAVLAGADDERLGALPRADALLPDAVLQAAQLPLPAERRARERLAFAHLLRLPRTTLLRRRSDGLQVPAESTFVSELRAAFERRGRTLERWADPRTLRRVPTTEVTRPLPVVAAPLLPSSVSASAVADLRACPYQFFVRRVLRADMVDELDAEFGKRDYGNWLHAVLHRFHVDRDAAPPRDRVADAAALRAAGDAVQSAAGIDAAALSPYRATFEELVPAYVDWLHAREADGVRWSAGEVSHAFQLPGVAGLTLTGKLDRVDIREGADGTSSIELIDYKTGRADTLEQQADDPGEDTQLATYAAVVAATDPRPVRAFYLPLDQPGSPIEPIEHVGVEASARTLVAELGDAFERLRAGAALPAIGEGRACRWCDAAGVCRKAHWPPRAAPDADVADDGTDASATP